MKYWRETIICALIGWIIIKHNNVETTTIVETVVKEVIVTQPCPEGFEDTFRRNSVFGVGYIFEWDGKSYVIEYKE
tara:strand:- start:944 stop:1171 length:228 start_codon:yes stop_codon:yes gene_type:complete